MKSRIVFLLLATLIPPAALRADETSDFFLGIWKQQAEQPDPADERQKQDIAAAWQNFAIKYPTHDLGWSARLLQGEELLRQGGTQRTLRALKVFETVSNDPAATSTESHLLASKAAKNLESRAKMALLVGKLQAYYRQHVEYPASLDDLIAGGFATETDATDPFGSRFVYAAMERSTFPGEGRQKFTLACPSIHAQQDDLAATLEAARSAPKGIVLNSTDVKDHHASLKKARPDGSMGPSQRMTVGQELGDVVLLAVCDGYVVVGWRGFPVVILKE